MLSRQTETSCRIASSVMQTSGYFVLIQVNQPVGMALQCVGALLTLPWLVRVRARDVLAQTVLFFWLDLTGFIALLTTGELPSQ